jgi:hypothetical protein
VVVRCCCNEAAVTEGLLLAAALAAVGSVAHCAVEVLVGFGGVRGGVLIGVSFLSSCPEHRCTISRCVFWVVSALPLSEGLSSKKESGLRAAMAA